MARHKKDFVDYFPHYAEQTKTLFIVEQIHGNDGYTFWFKLLESLASAHNHYLDLNCKEILQFVSARARITPEKGSEILDLLARLGAIDGELWIAKIVWSDNFIAGVSDAYRNRKRVPPLRPEISEIKNFTGSNSITTSSNVGFYEKIPPKVHKRDIEVEVEIEIEKNKRLDSDKVEPPKPKKVKKQVDPFVLPAEYLSSKDFLEKWNNFIEHRKKKGSPMTDYAKSNMIVKLGKFPMAVRIAALQKSIDNTWTGVFPESVNGIAAKQFENGGPSGSYNEVRTGGGSTSARFVQNDNIPTLKIGG